MNLRRRLILLLTLFGLYAVLAGAAGVFASHAYLGRTAQEFQRIAGHTTRVEELELYLTEQIFLLEQLVDGNTQAMPRYADVRQNWTETLRQCVSFAPVGTDLEPWKRLNAAAEAFEAESNNLLDLIDRGQRAQAGELLTSRLNDRLVPELRRSLVSLQTALATARNESSRALASASSRILVLTVAVGLLAALLVLVGGALVHRWLIRPISHLQMVTRRFRDGDLTFRSKLPERDELGQLGAALNATAEALAASETKQRTLFANLRDAVVLCDRDGRIVEYHDGDTHILGVADGQHVGRPLLEVWPEWKAAAQDWAAIVRSAVDDGRKLCLHDVHLEPSATGTNGRFVDFVVYRVDCGTKRCAGIVVRDVSQRRKLQDQLRHAEIMEAVGTMAGGLAHDVNNLLSSVTGSLTSLANDLPDPKYQNRISAALRSCRRAAGLSKRLLNFARGVHGTPQVFAPAEVTETILDSVESSTLEGIIVHRTLDPTVRVQMDQDQFAQILLNLLRNAADACSNGGRIEVSIQAVSTAAPHDGGRGQPFARLTVTDDGAGMAPDVEGRVFEPFFTTKARTGARGRGMGLTMVYAATKSANGFVDVRSEPDVGTTVSVYIPLYDQRDGVKSATVDAAGQ